MTPQKMNAVTWAALSVYAATVEGAAVPGLGEVLRAESPRLGRMREAARAQVVRLGLGNAGG